MRSVGKEEDRVVRIGKSILQHGRNNNRIYLMKLSETEYPYLIDWLTTLARSNRYTKIFAKIPPWALQGFQERGYRVEAKIPGFFKGKETAYFMALYLDSARARPHDEEKMQKVKERALAARPMESQLLPDGFRLDLLSPENAQEMAEVYRQVFETYPFPIFSEEYIKQTLRENVICFGIRSGSRLIASSSCEVDWDGQNAEMTDFATLPDYRSKGLASSLLREMEREMAAHGILTVFTIARALSFGMNITFAKHGYAMSGRLINNTDISGSIESMNVWHKRLC